MLEDALLGNQGIRAVDANILTGRLLVIYAPQTPLADIVALIESKLDGKRNRKSRRRPGSGRPRFRVSRVLDGFGALLRQFSSSSVPQPVFGMAADGAVASSRSSSNQPQQIRPWHA